MANIIDLPDFMFQGLDRSKVSKIKKIYLFVKGVLIGFINKKTNKKLYCLLINIFFNNANLNFNGFQYSKKLEHNLEIFYPNKRIDRVIINPERHFNFLFESYCLDKIKFLENDLVIDCGANVGELYFSFIYKNLNLKYIGFEPDKKVFNCLSKNLKNSKSEIYHVALSDKNELKSLYIDSDGANSSLIEFSDKSIKQEVKCRSLDSYKFKKVKLFKLEAEGYEIEILKGAKNTLGNIEYISVDYGPERGKKSDLTIANVTNFLFENKFTMIDGSRYRYIGLFKNSSI